MSLKLFGYNTAIYAVGNIGLRAASFLLIPLYTHLLSVSDYGLLATLIITIHIMAVFTNLGMRMSLIRFMREFGQGHREKYLLGTTTFVTLLGGALMIFTSLVVLQPLFRKILHTEHTFTYISLTCFAALLQALSLHVMSCYRARNQAARFMATGIAAAVLLLVTNLIFLWLLDMGARGALVAYNITYLIIFIGVLVDIASKTGLGLSPALIPKLLRFGVPFVFSMFGGSIMAEASIYFLSYYLGLEVVAIYSLGYKLAQILSIAVILPFHLAFQPYVFSHLDAPDITNKISLIFTYLLFVIAVMSFFILQGAHIILPLIAPPEYAAAFNVLIMLLPLMTSVGVYYFSETLLGAVQKTHIIALCISLCSVTCVGLNCLLIPILHWHGAIIASNLTFFLGAFMLLYIGIKDLALVLEWKRITLILVFFGLFLVTEHLLHGTGNLCFYGGTVLLPLMGIFFFGSFFSEQEKSTFKNSAARIKATLTA